MMFTRSLLFGTALAFGPLAMVPAAAQMDKQISEVDVSADSPAFVDGNALQFYPQLEADLESRIAEELAGQLDDAGGTLQVIVSEVSVDGDAVLDGATPFNRMSAGVFYIEPGGAISPQDSNEAPDAGQVTVVAVPDVSMVPGDATAHILMPPSDDQVYQAMVEALASEVVKELATL